MTPPGPWWGEPAGLLLFFVLPCAVWTVWRLRRDARKPAEPEATGKERLALRPDETGELDDVVVRDVEMFRAEVMDDDALWMCCYLPGTGVALDGVTFWVRAVGRNARLEFYVTEFPSGDVTYEPGSITTERRRSA